MILPSLRTPDSATLSPGQALGVWRLGQRLAAPGVAGLAEWYDASHALASDQSRVALLLEPGPQTAALFLRYGELTAELPGFSHPVLKLPVDSGFSAAGHPFLLFDAVWHSTLLQEAEQLSIAQRLEKVLQLCAALRELHQQGFLLSEIDPSQIWLNPRGQLQVFGLGVCRMADPADISATPSAEAQPSLSGEVYSLGLLLQLLLKGKGPEQEATLAELPAPSESAWRALPVESQQRLDALLSRACASEAVKRHLGIEDLADDLHAYLAEHQALEVPKQATIRPAKSGSLVKKAHGKRNLGRLLVGAAPLGAVAMIMFGNMVKADDPYQMPADQVEAVELADAQAQLSRPLTLRFMDLGDTPAQQR